MSDSAFLTPRTLGIATEILQWAKDYLMSENPHIKRPRGSQVVCPFVGPSIRENNFYIAFHPEVNGAHERDVERVMLAYVDSFLVAPPYEAEQQLTKALVVVFPELKESETGVLDLAHKKIKSVFVEKGLMVAQFHKKCKESGIYNRGFKVNVSPHPLMAVRHMAIHDILFLGSDPTWFNYYNLRFGDKFREPEKIEDHNKHLVELYFNAKQRFSG